MRPNDLFTGQVRTSFIFIRLALWDESINGKLPRLYCGRSIKSVVVSNCSEVISSTGSTEITVMAGEYYDSYSIETLLFCFDL